MDAVREENEFKNLDLINFQSSPSILTQTGFAVLKKKVSIILRKN